MGSALDALTTIDLAAPRSPIAELVRAEIGAHAAISFTVADRGERIVFTNAEVAGVTAAAGRTLVAAVHRGELELLFDPRSPAADYADRVIALGTATEMTKQASTAPLRARLVAMRALLSRHALASLAHHRALICDGARLLAVVDALYECPPTRRQQGLFSDLIPALRRRHLALEALQTHPPRTLIGAVVAAQPTPRVTTLEVVDTMLSAHGLKRATIAVVRLLATGLDNKQIAARLGLATNTVEYHLTRTYARLGVTSRIQLLALLVDRAAAS